MKFGIYTLVIENYFRNYTNELISVQYNLQSKYFFPDNFGWGMGYVLLPPNHPFYGINYNDINIDVHGGLTYSNYFDSTRFLKWTNNRKVVGDITLDNFKNFNNYWMIGFDTNHYGDNLEKCSESYVINETQNILDQCLNTKIDGIEKYLSRYLRKDKLKKINNI